jgi:hypothetical protein
MANGTRPLSLLIVLVIGAAIGCCGHSKPRPTHQAVPGDHFLKVGPAAREVGAVISQSGKHVVFWQARDNTMTLQIRFKAADFPQRAMPPFEGGTNGQDQVFECKSPQPCKSGDVNANLSPPADGLYYKYWQTLIHADGTKEEADAGIIIQP